MKKVSICSFLFYFLISCSTDSDVIISDNKGEAAVQNAAKLNAPDNNANPFDDFGKQYYDALNSYQTHNHVPRSLMELDKQIKFISEEFQKEHFSSKTINGHNDKIPEIILLDIQGSIVQVVHKSLLEEPAKTILLNFMQELTVKRHDSFSSIYDFVVFYESKVLENQELTESDRKSILAVTSISRYSFYSDANRKDRDWEKSAGNHFIGSGTDNMSIISVIILTGKII